MGRRLCYRARRQGRARPSPRERPVRPVHRPQLDYRGRLPRPVARSPRSRGQADSKCAIITSGNLTDGGLRKNCEYGVSIHAPKLVKEVRQDFEGYAGLGVHLSMEEITGFSNDLIGLRATYQAENRRLVKGVGAKLRNRINNAEDRVLQFRAKSSTTQGIFCKTILYLLAKSALKTSELHPLIQQINPDLCDDNIDRVIGGMNFGKKWKHYVRNAQQALKREGKVQFDGERWSLTNA